MAALPRFLRHAPFFRRSPSRKMVSATLVRTIVTNSALRAGVQSSAATAGGHGGGWKVWRNISFFVAIPSVALCMVNAYLRITEHPHTAPEFKPYEHLRKRDKRFPWGDGQKSLFHNPHVNALPGGYEHDH
ncbi:cytochrome c oxidase subunit 6A, mitochondrial-like [Neocloeon triangulifer]|uniref:cytochrome c oxidase subunit 6A, mitochondrial-like n=1 Tax=Neocloeon triangulifer TaxID=2078957 RepID=UPI00286F5790|nr:cytochrome c oxidase subunit 6A, mitochondrial-like [Neocloeon triangulifer]